MLTLALYLRRYPVILSIENHCTIQQQKKIAQYLRDIFGDKLDVGDVLSGDSKSLPSPNSLKGKILIKVRTILWISLMWRCSILELETKQSTFYCKRFHSNYVAENGCS